MTTMATLIQERADAFMRHCVAGVTQQGKDKAAAFAICKACGNKAGYYQPGTKTKTAKGKKAIRAHARAKDAPGKDTAYERAVKSEGVMSMRTLIGRLEEAAGKKFTYKHKVSRVGGVTLYADQEDAGPYAIATSGVGTPFTFGDRKPTAATPGHADQRAAFYQAKAVQEAAALLWPGGQDDGLTATLLGRLVKLAKQLYTAGDDTGNKLSPAFQRRLIAAAQDAGLVAAEEAP
jgi:hypothetical protein